MKITELKPIIKKYNKEELESIVVELYKRIPKYTKEDYNIDNFIINIQNDIKTKTKKNDEVDFNELKEEIIYFLSCVDNDLYCSPNRIISKKDRSNWRFKVKRYYKTLNLIDPSTNDGETATSLLIELFKRMSIGSNRLLFTNWETFKALGVSQADFYKNLYNRIKNSKILNVEDKLKKIYDLLFVPSDPYKYDPDLHEIYPYLAQDNNERIYIINLADEKIKQYKDLLKNEKKLSSSDKFSIQGSINDNTELVVRLYIGLNQPENARNYFHKYYKKCNQEVEEYIILRILEEYELVDEWIKEYEKYPNIDYRESLKKQYNEYKKN